MDNIRLLMDGGYQVDVACNMKEGSTISAEKIQAMEQTLREMGCGVYHIPVPRKITALGAIFQSFRLLSLIHIWFTWSICTRSSTPSWKG